MTEEGVERKHKNVQANGGEEKGENGGSCKKRARKYKKGKWNSVRNDEIAGCLPRIKHC